MDSPSSPIALSAETLEQAYHAYRRQLYGAAYGVLHDADDAEDCVHDVLVRLWRQGHSYSPARGSLQAFLVVCVRNEALSRRRKEANRDRIVHEQVRPVSETPPPDDSAVARIDMARILERLNDAQREAVRLAYYDGLTHEQIAKRLDEPVGTIKSRLSNALRTLRGLLSQGDAP
jgi:RNA polymerase sigma-70 factor (ECF subfamily)